MKLLLGLLGLLVVPGGIALGFFVGLWLMFIGGIFQIVGGATADPVNATAIAWGAIRIIFATPAGALTGFITVSLGFALIANSLRTGHFTSNTRRTKKSR